MDSKLAMATQEHVCTCHHSAVFVKWSNDEFYIIYTVPQLEKHLKISHHARYKPGLTETTLWGTSSHNHVSAAT